VKPAAVVAALVGTLVALFVAAVALALAWPRLRRSLVADVSAEARDQRVVATSVGELLGALRDGYAQLRN
jgi:hypothetical protein